MATRSQEYSRVEPKRVPTLAPCPLCGCTAEMWRYQPGEGRPVTLTVMCSSGANFDEDVDSGCPFVLSANHFHAATIREAAKYWNGYAQWVLEQRTSRGAP